MFSNIIGSKEYLVFLSLTLLGCDIFGQPTINGFNPNMGPVGTVVNISGANFDPISANNIVYFGAVRAIVTSATTTTISAIVPISTSYSPITVTVNNLTAYSVLPFIVTFTNGGSFNAKKDFQTGVNPRMVVIGDLDLDGKPDLVVPNLEDNSISVLRNTSSIGTISFAPKLDFVMGSNCCQVAVGDIDGDGMLDVITLNSSSPGKLSVFKNQSTVGSIMLSQQDFGTQVLPAYIAIGDIDGDGRPDLIVGYFGKFIGIWRNTTTGGVISFAPEVDFLTSGNITCVFVGDLDGDNKPDLVGVDNGSSKISIFRNTSTSGIISFGSSLEVNTGLNPSTVALGDLDGDGKLDLAVTSGYPAIVSVYLNTSTLGAISMGVGIDYPLVDLAYGISIGDIDGDGKPDLAPAILNSTPSYISTFSNSSVLGNISFRTAINYTVGENAFSDAIVDVDGDGKPDLITANATSNTVSVLQNVTPTPLPLSLLNFSASVKGREVELFWLTGIEINTSYFNIERSLESHVFSSIGTLKASDNANGMKYSFLDGNLPADLLYYRLKMVDIDGKFSYSPVIQIHLDSVQRTLAIYPNPSNKILIALHPEAMGKARLNIIDFMGRIVQTINVEPGTTQTLIILNNLSCGLYEVIWKDSNTTLSQSLLIN
jgi:hypothetical protein